MASKIGSVLGRVLGLAITYVVLGALWPQMTGFITGPGGIGGSPYGAIAQIGMYLFIALLPFLIFAPEIKDML